MILNEKFDYTILLTALRIYSDYGNITPKDNTRTLPDREQYYLIAQKKTYLPHPDRALNDESNLY